MKFSEYLNEGIVDDRENEKFTMTAKVSGKEMPAKRMNGSYHYYSELTKKWMPVSKSMITFTDKNEKDNNPADDKTSKKEPENAQKRPGMKSSVYNAKDNKSDYKTPNYR